MHYNKLGNLSVVSTTLDTLQSISDHRIVRSVIGSQPNAENALKSMRQIQDPWLYTPVVSTAYSSASGFTITASLNKTVKVWKVSPDESSIDLRGNWQRDGRVGFVVTSNNHNRVATASDVSSRAIRAYNFEDGISESPYDTYDCEKATVQAQKSYKRET
jgi:WD40 repeat protein